MRAWKLSTLLTASAACLPLPALGADCRILAEVDRQLVVARADGSILATLAGGEHGWWVAASFSPDGRYVLYSQHPAVYGDPVDIHLAELDGSELDVLRVTADAERDWDIQSIIEIDWFDDDRFWYSGRVGFRGRYVDVWKIAPRIGFATSELESRLAVLGGPCTFSPELNVVACAFEDHLASGISLFDYRKAVGGELLPQADPPDDYDAFVLAVKRQGADRETGAEGLTWDPEGRRLLFVVRGAQRLELGTLEGHGEGTGGWSLNLRALTGIESGVRAIRVTKGGHELLTDAGPFWVGQDIDKASAHGALEARAVEKSDAALPAGLKEFMVLDRWCPGGRK